MRIVIRVVAILAAVSVLFTVWGVVSFATGGTLSALARSGWLGGLTIVGWAVTLIAGPIAVIQLWRFRESGRRAGIVLFGFGVAYYLVGLVLFRIPESDIGGILIQAATFALPVCVLLSARGRALFERSGRP